MIHGIARFVSVKLPVPRSVRIPQHRQPVLLIERQHLVIEHAGCRDRGFGFVEFGLGDLGVCIDTGPLIDPADAL